MGPLCPARHKSEGGGGEKRPGSELRSECAGSSSQTHRVRGQDAGQLQLGGEKAEGWLGSSSFQATRKRQNDLRKARARAYHTHQSLPRLLEENPDASPWTLSSQGLGGSQGVSAHRARDPADGTRALTLPGRNHPHVWPRDSHRSVLTKRAHNQKPLDTQEDEVP